MQFSSGPYYTPMDREYHDQKEDKPRLEKPILPINELGVTVPEKDPVTGGHILQNIDASIRMGASKMQIVMTQPSSSPIGGRPKAYGKEVRENIRELTRANNVTIEGVEMPTSSMYNLSGFDMQHNSMNEERRQRDLQEVKEAIKFVADIAGGGGVDIWSQEFARDIYDASWNNKDSKWKGKFESFEGEQQYATALVVDKRTGKVVNIPKGQPIYEPIFETAAADTRGKDINGNDIMIKKGDWVTDDGRLIDPTDTEQLILRRPKWNSAKQEFEVKPMTWDEIANKTKDINSRFNKDMLPEEYAVKMQLANQWIQRKGGSLYYSNRYEDYLKSYEDLKKAKEYYKKVESQFSDEEAWRIMKEDHSLTRIGGEFVSRPMKKPTELIEKELRDIEHHLKHVHEASSSQDAQAKEIEEQMNSMVSLKRYALEKSFKSYADAGIAALEETMNNRNVERPIHVGPELGWPTAYGGHPEEFIELIKNSRKEMADRLVKEKHVSQSEAKELAERHIQGCLDTGHLGMWLQHFKKEQGESEEQHVKRFNNWFMDMIKKMQSEGVIGSVQAVDSASGAHGHLPAGQGIFPVVEAVDYLKSHGFSGFVVSEGHEEEQFGRGRILLQTWRAFGADIADSYFSPERSARWSDVADTYFGHVNPPSYVVGDYRPTDDWVFWSGVPLE